MTHILQVTAGEKIGPLHRVNIRADGKAYYWQAGDDPEPMYFAIYAAPEGHSLRAVSRRARCFQLSA